MRFQINTRPKMFRIVAIIFTCVFLIIGSVAKLQAQSQPINISISVNPPFSADALDYFNSPTQTTLTLINTSQQVQNVFLAGSLRNLSTNQSVTIRNDIIPAVPVLSLNPGVTVFTGVDLQIYVDEAALKFTGITQQEAFNGNLPEGEYQPYLTSSYRADREMFGIPNNEAIVMTKVIANASSNVYELKDGEFVKIK